MSRSVKRFGLTRAASAPARRIGVVGPRAGFLLWRLIAFAILSVAMFGAAKGHAQTTVQDLFAMSYSPGRLTRINGRTGDVVYSVNSGGGYYVTQGPDGFLYVAGGKRDPANGSGGFQSVIGVGPYGSDFGPDGNFYNGAQTLPGRVFRVDRNTGRTSAFVQAGSGGLGPVEAVRFGPDGNLYVTEYSDFRDGGASSTNRVLRYNGMTGAFLDVFASDPRLANTRSLDWGPNGNLFVASQGTTLNSGNVVEFDGATGAFVRVFADGLDVANGLAFGPDGNLYVGLEIAGSIKRFNGTTGAFIDDFATGLPAGLVGLAWATVTVPEPTSASLAFGLFVCVASRGRQAVRRHPQSAGGR